MYVVFQQSLKNAKSYNIAVGERVVVVGGRGYQSHFTGRGSLWMSESPGIANPKLSMVL